MSPLAARLLDAIKVDLAGRASFVLPPNRVAVAIQGSGWHGAVAALRELVQLGEIVVVSRNVRNNLVYRLPRGEPVPLPRDAVIPIERCIGRTETSRRDKAETVLAFLRSRHRVGESFSIGQNEAKRLLHTSCATIANAIADLMLNDVIEIVEPLKARGGVRPGGKRGAVLRLTGRELPDEIEIARRTSLAPRVDMHAVRGQSNKSAGSAPRAEVE